MASLNLSANGSSISKSYQSIVSSPPPSGNATRSSTYGQWAVFSVTSPLFNAFQQDNGGKESVLKVQSTGEGELVDLLDEFSDGRVQFAFLKIKDPNTSLPKYVLIGWCGEGVPERTKGYFTSHQAAVAKVLHGYHVQITARSDRDLTPDTIIQKVSDASGAKYTSSDIGTTFGGPPPPVSSKPAFMPTRTGGAGGFNPVAGSKANTGAYIRANVDRDGWGEDAPPVTRTELEKVQSSYRPTKVNMRELSSQKPEPSKFDSIHNNENGKRSDVIKGVYQPVGKVDIAALRRQAQESGSANDDKPSIVKGSYEPVGKVDIAAIRARAQGPSGPTLPPSSLSPADTGTSNRSNDRIDQSKSIPEHSATFSTSERLTSLPKPKIANRFGSNASNYSGTKVHSHSEHGFESKVSPSAPLVGVGRTFADEGGKTPAQMWAEKKARERGLSGASEKPPVVAELGGPTSPIASQTSGGGEWKSGYTGKSWAPVSTSKTGQSASSLGQQHTGQDAEHSTAAPRSPTGGIGALRDRFKDAPPMGATAPGLERAAPSPPPLENSNKPNVSRGTAIPGLSMRPDQASRETPSMSSPPPQPPRSPTPPTPPAMEESGSPIRVAMPVGRGQEPAVGDARDEQFSPPPAMPVRSLAQATPHEDELEEEISGPDPARSAGVAVAAASFGQHATDTAQPGTNQIGKRALVQYDYEKAEDNELELKEGEYVTNIEMVDEDWWMGQNQHGETGLFPSNYVELVEDNAHQEPMAHETAAEPALGAEHDLGSAATHGATATALYDYEAAEDNELSFPEGAKITGVEFPDEDWWSGDYGGKMGLFPANYVQLDG